MSNVTGSITDFEEIKKKAKNFNIPILVDGCQYVPHKKLIIKDLDPDFYVFSAHKLYGPSGLGVLYMKDYWIDRLGPYQGGGSMIKNVETDSSTYLDGIHKFEAGTPPIAEVIGLSSCINFINEVGIDRNKRHEVTKIISNKNKITGIQLDDQTIIQSNNVICNADPPAVYEKMLNGNTSNSFLFRWKKNRMEYSMGLFVYYFGTKKKYDNVEHHTIKFGNKYKEHLDDIFNNKKLNNDISYYLHRPSATDKTMAPEGNDCFYVLVPVPNNQSKIDWSVEGEKMKNLVIDKMQNDLMPDLKNNIVEDFYLTPDYFERDLNTKYGSGFSIQPKFSQSAYFRFHNKSEIYKGLYFVGAGTHPGAGVPGVLSSAKVLEKIL